MEREEVLTGGRYVWLAEAQWRHLTDRRNRVRQDKQEIPCKGTMGLNIPVEGEITMVPLESDHQRLVDRWRQPLCR